MQKSAIIYDKWLAGMGGGEVVACTMARVLKDAGYTVTLISQTEVNPKTITQELGVLMNDIPFVVINDDENELRKRCQDKDLFINISFMDYAYGYAKRNIYYVHFPTVSNKSLFAFASKFQPFSYFYNNYLLTFPSGVFNYILHFFKISQLHRLFPKNFGERIEDRLRAGVYHNLSERLKSYQLFITHSEYVKKWVKIAWNIDAKVLYPPVSLLNSSLYTLHPKSNWIVSLGRFFTLGHGKKQEIMIEAFKKMYDQYSTRNSQPVNPLTGLQLHLVGGVGKEPSSLRFIEDLRETAKGYPIFFHYNVSRTEVEDILLKSKIYWHATGYGEDPELDPIKFEHFGIAPIEAISAGCIPVLFDGGGLKEIIRLLNLDPKLYLYSTINELIENTTTLLNMNISVHPNLSMFTKETFIKKFLKIVNEIS